MLRSFSPPVHFRIGVLIFAGVLMVGAASTVGEAAGLTFEQLAAMRSVREVEISPDGGTIAYTLRVPRRAGVDEDGAEWRELHVIDVMDGIDRTYIGGKNSVSRIRFTPDGEQITYLAEREGDEHDTLWAIPLAGGESRRLVSFDTAIKEYRVSPDGTTVAFVAKEPKSESREEAHDKGYSQEVFEEDWLPSRVWLTAMPPVDPPVVDPSAKEEQEEEDDEPRALPLEGSAFNVRWSPDGLHLAVDLAPTPLIDDRYMHRRVHVVDASTGEVRARFDNPGKLGDFGFSPDGARVAMVSAADPNDPAAGRLMVAPAGGGDPVDLLPGLEGHIKAFAWRDPATLVFLSDEGEETRLATVGVDGDGETSHLISGVEEGGVRVPVMTGLSVSSGGDLLALVGESPVHAGEVYTMALREKVPRRITDSNPWLRDVRLAPQEVFRHQARDGLELSGVLIRPLDAGDGPAPLILSVHGGPEGHRRNGWLTVYYAPGQLAAARGYAVFYPNYRGSTGRGVAFSKLGQGDAAGAEFDDLVDAVDALAAAGIVDPDRVGVTGGSYGGYATGWLATRYSERFRAGVMFVGISNKVSKGMTTEIPVEDIMVHTRFQPYTRWQFSLERSPIYHVEKCRTPLLIAGGTDDSRVHPSQSLQLYRALKLIGKAPVRYVRYPGEEHGNARAAARDDYARRLVRWMDHFVVQGNTDLPPWELENSHAEE
jgi:dipeptidyl aminopeptidase/acylaminoacyl peptidase